MPSSTASNSISITGSGSPTNVSLRCDLDSKGRIMTGTSTLSVWRWQGANDLASSTWSGHGRCQPVRMISPNVTVMNTGESGAGEGRAHLRRDSAQGEQSGHGEEATLGEDCQGVNNHVTEETPPETNRARKRNQLPFPGSSRLYQRSSASKSGGKKIAGMMTKRHRKPRQITPNLPPQITPAHKLNLPLIGIAITN
jgi:hypothetical protein